MSKDVIGIGIVIIVIGVLATWIASHGPFNNMGFDSSWDCPLTQLALLPSVSRNRRRQTVTRKRLTSSASAAENCSRPCFVEAPVWRTCSEINTPSLMLNKLDHIRERD
jgi:hypothetical protein